MTYQQTTDSTGISRALPQAEISALAGAANDAGILAGSRLNGARHQVQYTDPVARFFAEFNDRTGRGDLFLGYMEGHLANNIQLTGKDSKAADFGCGTGWLTTQLARHFGRVYGIDTSESMLKLAWANVRNKTPNVLLYQTVPENIKGDCDFVTAVHVHYHFDTKEKLRKEFFEAAADLLKPNGELLLIGCPSDHINNPPSHYSNKVSVDDLPEDVKNNATQLSLLQDSEGYIHLADLPKFPLKDGTQMKVEFHISDDRGRDKSISLTDTYWSNAALIEAAKEAGLEHTMSHNMTWRGHANSYMVMHFKKPESSPIGVA